MGKTYERIDADIRAWVARQQLFFVGTAPTQSDGHINVSPKGLNALRILDDHTLAYVDVGGSGAETIAHVRENGRIVIMLCAFEGPPKIFRFYGRGDVHTPLDPDFSDLRQMFDLPDLGTRAIVKVNVTRIADSCGYGVPLFEYKKQRDSMQNWQASKGIEAIREGQVQKNLKSIDSIDAVSEDEARAFQF